MPPMTFMRRPVEVGFDWSPAVLPEVWTSILLIAIWHENTEYSIIMQSFSDKSFNFTETDHLVKLRYEPLGNTIIITFQSLTKSYNCFPQTSPNFTTQLSQIATASEISSLATFRLIRRSFDFSVVGGCYGCALCLGTDLQLDNEDHPRGNPRTTTEQRKDKRCKAQMDHKWI